VAVVDALGYLARFTVLPGRAHGLTGVPEDPAGRGAEAMIPSRWNRTAPREMCGWRHPVENFFAKTREFRAIVTRHDRTDGSFAAGIHPVAGVIAAS